jgi:ABC-type multidrug transport system ATPase subunit
LTYTALLRMPGEMKSKLKHQEVEKVIRMLRLNHVAASPIYLLSGGEKKRVNIGTELLTDPSVLLLDEPTSGLDSTSAVSLLKLLQSFASENGKTVITTIHQPSSAVFRSFDRLMMLSEGRVVYFGTPVDSLDYLHNLDLACPEVSSYSPISLPIHQSRQHSYPKNLQPGLQRRGSLDGSACN